MKKFLTAILATAIICLGATVASASNETLNHNGKAKGAAGRGHKTSAISYHGGPVMTGTPNVYVIWYGTWAPNSTTPAILTNFLSNVGGSPYYNINTTYYNGSGVHVSNAVHYAGSVNQAAPYGQNITGTDINNIVSGQINSGALPLDPNGVYFVLTSSDINYPGFMSNFCGYHGAITVNGVTVKRAFVGDAGGAYACSQQTASSPNNNVPADAMASVVAHELEETTSDPQLNAWYDAQGNENADKCAWTFGTQLTAANGSKYNMVIGGRQYLIQQNWVNQGQGFCALSY